VGQAELNMAQTVSCNKPTIQPTQPGGGGRCGGCLKNAQVGDQGGEGGGGRRTESHQGQDPMQVKLQGAPRVKHKETRGPPQN